MENLGKRGQTKEIYEALKGIGKERTELRIACKAIAQSGSRVKDNYPTFKIGNPEFDFPSDGNNSLIPARSRKKSSYR
jgi:hypothetical protein